MIVDSGLIEPLLAKEDLLHYCQSLIKALKKNFHEWFYVWNESLKEVMQVLWSLNFDWRIELLGLLHVATGLLMLFALLHTVGILHWW